MEKRKIILNKVCLFSINFVILFLIYGLIVINKHYSSDDFFCYFHQVEEAYAVSFQSYRGVLGLLYLCLHKLGINVVSNQITFGIFMLLCFALSSSALYHAIAETLGMSFSRNSVYCICLDVGTLIFYICAFIVEWAWFALAYLQWGLSVALAIYSAIVFNSEKLLPPHRIIGSFLLLALSAGIYQVALSYYVFVVLLLIYVSTNGRITKEAFWKSVIAAIVAVGALSVNIIAIKFIVRIGYGYASYRTSMDFSTILENLKLLLSSQKSVWLTGLGFFPQYFLVGMLYMYIAALFVICVLKKSFESFIFALGICLMGCITLFVSIVMQATSWSPVRMLVPLFSVFAVLHICTLQLLTGHTKGTSNRRLTKACVAIVFALSLFFSTVNIIEIEINSIDCIKTLTIEEYEVRKIISWIDEKNISFENISFVCDQFPSYKYYDMLNNKIYGGEMATRGILVDWSNIEIINFYAGTNYIECLEPDVQYTTSLGSKNYTSLDEDQLTVRDGTLYIVLY